MSDGNIRVAGGFLCSNPFVEGEFFRTPKDTKYNFFTDYRSTSAQLSVGGDYWSAGLQSVDGSGNTRYLRIGQNYYGAVLEGRFPVAYWLVGQETLKNLRFVPHLEINYGESWKVNVDEEGKVDRESMTAITGFQWAWGLLVAVDALLADFSHTKAGIEAQGGFLFRNDLETDTQMEGFVGGFKLFAEWK